MDRKNFNRIAAVCILIGFIFLQACTSNSEKRFTQWRVAGGSKENIRYSTLHQIDTSNVGELKIAWVYHSMDEDNINHSQIQCNPIIIDGVLYGTSPQLKLLALDAITGKEKWIFDPHKAKSKGDSSARLTLNNSRGVTYWEEGSDKRIFYSVGPFLFSIHAGSGELITSFGNGGSIDLHDGLERDVHNLSVTSTSPGIIFNDLLIVGTRVSEGSDAAPGHIRAYDVKTGKQRWIFHTIPQPGEFGFDTWEDSTAYRHIGGANSWSGFSLDEKRGILFAPTGSAAFDFYGGKRKGANLFANCLLALDAATGKYIWHFQTVHHDVWDWDIPTPPALVTVSHEGRQIDAVAQPTKSGFVFLFDRETGKPLFPVEEISVSTNSELTGEKLWPTQPIPSLPKPFARQRFTEEDLNDLVPDSSYQDLKKKFLSYQRGALFTPPSKQGTIVFPGFDGAAEWGGPSFDPTTGVLYVNANEMPWVLTIVDVKTETPGNETNLKAGTRLYIKYCMACHGPDRKGGGNYPSLIGVEKRYNEASLIELMSTGRRMMPAFKNISEQENRAIASYILELKSKQKDHFETPPVALDSFLNLPYSTTGYNKFLTKEGLPAINPPWGTLNAINLNTGKINWQIPLGEYPEFKQKGIITGTENYGGPVVTSGGLLFIAASRDGKFRAFNKLTGKLLWETDLPAPGFATPSLYEAGGKQYIAIACGGGKLGTKSGDAYVAFALP